MNHRKKFDFPTLVACQVTWGLLVILAGTANAEDLAKSTVQRLQADLNYFASDELSGRDVGSEGIAKAGEFIVDRFTELGLKTDSFDGSAYQEFTIPGPAGMGAPERNTLSFSGEDLSLDLSVGTDFNSLSLGSSGSFDGDVVFAGYGISAPDLGYDDYADFDATGKVVIVIRKEPQQRDEQSIFEGTRSSQYAYFSTKELNAALHKAAALIIVNDRLTAANADQLTPSSGAGSASTRQQVPTYFCKREVVDKLLAVSGGKSLLQIEEEIDEDLKPQSFLLEGVRAKGEALIEKQEIPVRNVVGFLPGSGDLAEEYVVVGAHYDHVGMGGQGSLAPGTIAIHNGADDNGSGTITLLEVARRLASNDSQHRRNLVFMAFTGEEKGLLGSKHYVRNPRWPLEKTVAMVNMDMVGRLTDNQLTVYGIGTAKEFDGILDRLNETTKFDLDKRVAGFGPSDHASFYQVEIPVFHFFTGLHSDYHRPSDDPDKVNYEGMSRIANMVTDVVTEIATAEDKPTYMQTNARANVGRRRAAPAPRAVIGIQLDLEFGGAGAGIDDVPEGGPGAAAGLQAGDVIVRIGDTVIESVRDLRQVMADKKPGDKISVTVKRGEEDLTVEVELGRG